MAKRANRVPDEEAIERTIWVPGWGYNYLVERAKRQPWVNPKTELSRLIERALREEIEQEQAAPPG